MIWFTWMEQNIDPLTWKTKILNLFENLDWIVAFWVLSLWRGNLKLIGFFWELCLFLEIDLFWSLLNFYDLQSCETTDWIEASY